ncbi:MAG: abortive infection family protein [Mogibacterium diversum]|jgi:hypothetical protein|uniref:abortive infection family protein n=1 Tax=Mogibacterium diversum TaxID=114527 RepID=UPI00205E8595|nr:abortive infection family protein [Mogibacterium diversum]UQF81949.1 MAG: abortive infection family protein [Mogibacterium diversum]
MTDIEKGAFLKLFIRNGYVLNFSTNDFDVFTAESIGIALCQKYGLSKGKSLTAFCSEADPNDFTKLLIDMLQYYELYIFDTYGEEKNKALFEKCKEIAEREGKNIQFETPSLVCVNRNYIRELISQASRAIGQRDYESAITKSRTLLEEVFCYVLEKKDISPDTSGEIGKLYKQVRGTYNMHTDKDMDKRINTLLSGLNNIVSAIAEMRNKGSDSHGVGSARINIQEHHARLLVNSAMVMADFILSVANKTPS